MLIFEDSKGKGRTAIVFEKREGQILIEAMDAACNANKRKTSWKNFRKKLKDLLACY